LNVNLNATFYPVNATSGKLNAISLFVQKKKQTAGRQTIKEHRNPKQGLYKQMA
jgi:hypothetical protein